MSFAVSVLVFGKSLSSNLCFISIYPWEIYFSKTRRLCRVYGPRTVYCFPWVSSPVAIGWNWAEFSRGNWTFYRFQVIFFWIRRIQLRVWGGNPQYKNFQLILYIFFLSKFKFRALKSGCDWLISGWKIGGPSCAAGFCFLGEIHLQLDSPCKTACHRVY